MSLYFSVHCVFASTGPNMAIIARSPWVTEGLVLQQISEAIVHFTDNSTLVGNKT